MDETATQTTVKCNSVTCSMFSCFSTSDTMSEETWFPDEDFYLHSLFTNDPVAAAGSNQPDITQLLGGDHSHATPSLKSASLERSILQPVPQGDRPVPKQRLSCANLRQDYLPPQLAPDKPKSDNVAQDNQNTRPDTVSSDPPPAPDSHPIPLPNPAQDLILPDVHNLIGDQEPDSSFVHRYN